MNPAKGEASIRMRGRTTRFTGVEHGWEAGPIDRLIHNTWDRPVRFPAPEWKKFYIKGRQK